MSESNTRRQRGQSVIIVAAAFLALVLFVAISVDIGSAYVQRRTAQNAADAAAFAGGRELMRQRNEYGTKITNKGEPDLIRAEMNDFAERNEVEDTDGVPANEVNDNLEAYYLGYDGSRLGEILTRPQDRIPAYAVGVEAVAHINAPTFFGSVFGIDGLPLSALAAVSLNEPSCGVSCVVPIATYWYTDPLDRFETSALPDDWGTRETPYTATETLPFTCYNIWNGSGPGNFGWLNWENQADGEWSCNVTEGSDDCSAQCLGYNLDPDHCTGYVQIGEWIFGTTGTKNASATQEDSVRYQLNDWVGGPEDLTGDGPEPFVVPLFNTTNEGGGCAGGFQYQVAGFAKMQMIGYKLPQGEHYDPWVPDPCRCVNVSEPWLPEDDPGCGEMPNYGERITAFFIDFIDPNAFGGECFSEGSVTVPMMIK